MLFGQGQGLEDKSLTGRKLFLFDRRFAYASKVKSRLDPFSLCLIEPLLG